MHQCPNCKADLPGYVCGLYFKLARDDSILYKKLSYALADRLAKITGSTADNIIVGVINADKLTKDET
jgi:hypothetical protein